MNRRGFLGLLAAVVCWPTAYLRRAISRRPYVPSPWRILHEHCDGWDCKAKWRRVEKDTIEIDWWRCFAPSDTKTMPPALCVQGPLDPQFIPHDLADGFLETVDVDVDASILAPAEERTLA